MRKEIEKCFVCGKVLHIDDEAYTDHDTGHILCSDHAYFDEEIDMYRQVELNIPNTRPIGEWVCTDPNTNQYGRINADGTYDFKEDIKWPDGSVAKKTAAAIDLDDYSHDEKKDALMSFGYSNESLSKMCSADEKWITAECIFELNEIF